MNIKVLKLTPDAVIPVFAHETDTGFDLFTCDDVYIPPEQKMIIPTGLVMELPYGWGIQIKNKSGITMKGITTNFEDVKADITVYEGTIDTRR